MAPKHKTSVTLEDVAVLAKVSPSTISLYLRHPDKVSDKTGKKIKLAIEHCGYVYNKIASQFTGGRSSSMAIIIPSLTNSIFSDVVQRIEDKVSAAGYQLYVASHDHSLEKEEQQLRAILQWSPAVVAITGSRHTESSIKMLTANQTPVVQIWQVSEDSPFATQVGINHYQVGYAAGKYLLDSGCEQLAYFTTRFNDDIRAQHRYHGFEKAAQEFGKKTLLIEIPQTDNIYPAARDTLIKTLVKTKYLDGIFASSDAIATALLMEAIARKIKVPEQLSILGFGDFPSSGYFAPISLSSININTPLIAQHAAELMLNAATTKVTNHLAIDVGFDIIPRDSTRFLLSTKKNTN